MFFVVPQTKKSIRDKSARTMVSKILANQDQFIELHIFESDDHAHHLYSVLECCNAITIYADEQH